MVMKKRGGKAGSKTSFKVPNGGPATPMKSVPFPQGKKGKGGRKK